MRRRKAGKELGSQAPLGWSLRGTLSAISNAQLVVRSRSWLPPERNVAAPRARRPRDEDCWNRERGTTAGAEEFEIPGSAEAGSVSVSPVSPEVCPARMVLFPTVS